ncbi:MAG: glycosyltransferase [Candidatus Binatia bacterium]|nr:glycosyltransferase [Candidatus Binatia bacterium]
MTAVARARKEWDAAFVVREAERVRAGGVGGRVLKENEHGFVVWVEGAGPAGEAVVVKARHPNTEWSRLRDRFATSPAVAQQVVAEACAAAGVAVPEVFGVEDAGWPSQPCHMITAAVEDAEPLLAVLLRLDPKGRRKLARSVGRFVAKLHHAGIYVPDLKHENLMLREAGDAEPRVLLVDLDRARLPRGGVSRRRRIRNLVQLCWRLSWETTPRERLLMLGQYTRALGAPGESVAALAQDVDRERRRKQRRLLAMRRRMRERPTERPGISVMIVCQDEERLIRPCLESVAWCDEIVVVDGGSKDSTVEICREYTDRVLHNPWPGHRAQKQFALDQTTQPWVLNIDSDERVPEPLREELEWMLAHDGAGWDGFQVPRLVRYLGRWWWRGGWYPSRRLRLFRREKAEWGGVDPHEKAVVHGRIGKVKEPLWHLSYENVAHHLHSIDCLTDVGARAKPRRARWDRLYLRPPARFLRSWLVGRGCQEGFPGFFIALASALYVHVKHVKADEEAQASENRT